LPLVAAVRYLAEVINKNMGNIVIARIQTADKAPQRLEAVDVEFRGIYQTGLVAQIKAHVAGRLDAHHASGLRLGGTVHQLQQLLGLALTGAAHNQSNHKKSLLYTIGWET